MAREFPEPPRLARSFSLRSSFGLSPGLSFRGFAATLAVSPKRQMAPASAPAVSFRQSVTDLSSEKFKLSTPDRFTVPVVFLAIPHFSRAPLVNLHGSRFTSARSIEQGEGHYGWALGSNS